VVRSLSLVLFLFLSRSLSRGPGLAVTAYDYQVLPWTRVAPNQHGVLSTISECVDRTHVVRSLSLVLFLFLALSLSLVDPDSQ
jgi:hypothetical protein